jgi:hypothetical protein
MAWGPGAGERLKNPLRGLGSIARRVSLVIAQVLADPRRARDVQEFVGAVRIRMWSEHPGNDKLRLREFLAASP